MTKRRVSKKEIVREIINSSLWFAIPIALSNSYFQGLLEFQWESIAKTLFLIIISSLLMIGFNLFLGWIFRSFDGIKD